MPTTYSTFAQKDPYFQSHRIQDFTNLLALLSNLQQGGYFFRGMADAGWKLFTSAQRKWTDDQLHLHFSSIHEFIQRHIEYQRSNAAAQLALHCPQDNDIAILSTLQHYGGPTPFLDFSSRHENALFFATDAPHQAGNDETNAWISIYALKPDAELINWELQIDRYGGWRDAAQYQTLQGLGTFYIKQDSALFLQMANDRLRKQDGLFLYSQPALDGGQPYEELFDDRTPADVVDEHEGPFLRKMTCINIDKRLAPQIQAHLQGTEVTRQALGLGGQDWAQALYLAFLQHP